MKTFLFLSLAVFFFCTSASANGNNPLLLQSPTISSTHIVFAYAGNLWSVSREGGAAVPLTSGPGSKSDPKFSPDGKWIAFTAYYGGNPNVFVIPAEGGAPRQLTYDAGPGRVEGWTPDGKYVLFRSPRDSYSQRYEQLYTVPVQGGYAKALPLPMGYEGSYSPDGTHLAYTPLPREIFFADFSGFDHAYWAHYHGGLASQVWIANLADSSVVNVPHETASDFNPMWLGNKVYFLSARTEPVSLYEYDLSSKKVSRVIENNGMDIMSASAGPGAICYEQFGSLHIYDPASGREHEVHVEINGDFPEALPHFEKVADHVLNAQISPTGARAVFEAHGEILTVPADHGSIRNITNSPSVADRSPAWSPDGKWIAYFSDLSGEYELCIRSQDAEGNTRSISLGSVGFFYTLLWSPDSKKIAFTDQHLSLWYVDLDKGTPVKVDSDAVFVMNRELNPGWSPDSRWLTYTRVISNRMRSVFVYSLDSGKATQVTDGLSDTEYAAFDKSGKYLYFTASTDFGPTASNLDMTSNSHHPTRSVYMVILAKGVASPLAPSSDEEKSQNSEKQTDAAASASASTPAGAQVRIDFDRVSQRIIALPLAPANYIGLQTGKAGELFLQQAAPGAGGEGDDTSFTLVKFSLTDRQSVPLIAGIQLARVSFDGAKFLYRQGNTWAIASTSAPAKAGDGALVMDSMNVWVVPREEWKQMFHEAWRIQRDFFYATNYHGLNLKQAEEQYSAYLPGIASRQDLNCLFLEMLGKLSVGHMFVAGGDIPTVTPVSVGYLGCDYTTANGRYRFAKVYEGENWNPGLRAPLTEPGSEVAEGEYLLAVNGSEVRDTDDVFRFFLNTADKQVTIRVGPNPDGTGSREITVIPVANELQLRHRDWVISNLRKVDQLSGGKLAYVYLPDTGGGGYTSFNRYFFAQVDKQGLIVDERFNSGGQAADYIIQYLQRKLWNYVVPREGAPFPEPGEAIYGPKAMLINQYAGSGGDLIPSFFHQNEVGTLIGKRTWGGAVGITGYPDLIDGGNVTSPSMGFVTTDGKWVLENQGVSPDIEVEMDPKLWREGRDPQLETAVKVLLDQLAKNAPAKLKLAPFSDYSTKQ